jgi:malate dehydrogenase (oxaloacetate-decarboxylating)(NADP+)
MAMPRADILRLPHSSEPLDVHRRGLEILNNPWLNKGTAFSLEERRTLGLSGLLPPFEANMEEQVQRVTENYEHHADPLDKYIFLTGLADRNIHLFYRFLMDNLEETTPIMYTPTVGQACLKFGHIYRKNRGMYIQKRHLGRIAEVLNNWSKEAVDIIVVSDGSRILGLGDLGANGMGIPIGKLVLYVVGAGLHPERTLPVLLDVGTNNEQLLNDPLYLGMDHRRLDDEAFYELVDEFVQAARSKWPRVLIQWEDFTNNKAFPLLERYRDEVLCFNDDIQGTGAVALAGLLAAMRYLDRPLADQRVLFLGAGSAAVGIADTICAGIADEGGTPLDEARKQVWMVDSRGLVTRSREGTLQAHKLPYARDDEPAQTLLDAVQRIKPTILVGVSGRARSFNQDVIRAMNRHCDRPIVFALSNPTSKSECTAEEAYRWTNGKAIFASGSPFKPVRLGGRIFIPGQGNNMFIFPGIGLGAVVSGATRITDEMFYIAARTLAQMVTDEELASGTLYPDLGKIRQISLAIAAAVSRLAWDQGIASYDEPDDIRDHVRSCMWHPVYRPYTAA